MEPRKQVVVIGAGLAGLTAALYLAENGLTPIVLEADKTLAGGRLRGGLPARFSHLGQQWTFPSEHGIHGIWNQYHNFRDMLAHFDIQPTFVSARKEAWILRHQGGKVQWAEGGSALRTSWIPAPFHYLALFIRPRFLQMLTLRDLASMFRLLSGLMLAIAFDPAVEGITLEGRTLADFFKGWSPTLQALFVGLARNFTSAPPDQVPQAGFIAFLRFYTLLRRDAWAFKYFTQDTDTALIAPLQAKLDELGGTIQLDSAVDHLERTVDGWRVVWQNGELLADHIILALDAPAARNLLLASPDTFPEAIKMSWPVAVPTAVMRFWFSRASRRRSAGPEAGIFTGDFVLDNYFWLHRFQQPFIEWHKATKGSAIECHIYGPPELLTEPDAVLLAKALLELQRVWPELRGTVIHQTIRRNPATHTLFSVGQSDQHLGIDTLWENLNACGDWVRFGHSALFMERACVTGIAAANQVLIHHKLHPIAIREVDRPEIIARVIERFLRWIRRRARAYNRRNMGTTRTV